MEGKSLTDILRNGNGDNIRDLWGRTEAAGELGPLPPGEYVANVVAGELNRSRVHNTPGYKLTFKVCEGDYVGRQLWLDCWLTPAAMPQTKRDLSKLKVVDLAQLEQPLPRGIRCKCKVVIRRDDNGTEHNRVRRFDVVAIDTPERDAFAPADGNGKSAGSYQVNDTDAVPADDSEADAGAADDTTPF